MASRPAILAVACFIAALLIDCYVYGYGYNGPPIRSDGFGYYVYLPALFIHHDIFFGFLNDPKFAAALHSYAFPDLQWSGLAEVPNGFVDKYPVGSAIMQLPFFLVAYAIEKIGQAGPIAGFELPFQAANAISAAFYFAAAVYILFRVIARNESVLAAYLALFFAIMTTNVLMYASYDGSFAHIYSFFLVSALVAIVDATDRLDLRSFVFGILLGLAVIVRPTNAVAALLALQWWANAEPRRIARTLALALFGAALAAAPQAAVWLATSGRLITYTYNVGFDFGQPHLLDYLFSVRKGVFFWHPAYLLMILCLIAHYRAFPRQSLIFLAIVALNIYLGASWQVWSFGGSFGSRQTVDVLPVLIVATASAVAVLLRNRTSWLRAACAASAVCLAALNLVQMRGYITGGIPFDQTTWEIYKRFWADRLDWRPGTNAPTH
jgi:hypothetical protein